MSPLRIAQIGTRHGHAQGKWLAPRPAARRCEVYGSNGSAILEAFDLARLVRLALNIPSEANQSGARTFEMPAVSRQELYERELVAIIGGLRGQKPPDRSPKHELLVQETLLRATGGIS